MDRFKRLILVLLAIALLAAGFVLWRGDGANMVPDGFALGNGRIEAVEIDLTVPRPGRIDRILVREGVVVAAGDRLAVLDVRRLQAARHRAEAE